MHGEFHSFSVMSWTKPFKLRPDAASDTSRRNNRRVAMQCKLRRDAFSATSCLYQVSLFYTLRKPLWEAATKKHKTFGGFGTFQAKTFGGFGTYFVSLCSKSVSYEKKNI